MIRRGPLAGLALSLVEGVVLPFLLSLPAGAGAAVSVNDDWSRTGRVSVTAAGRRFVFARDEGTLAVLRGDGTALRPGSGPAAIEVARIAPFGPGRVRSERLASCRIAAQSATLVLVQASFAAGGTPLDVSCAVSDAGDLTVTPGAGVRGIAVRAPIAYGVLPGIVPDDVIYDPAKFQGTAVHVPAESLFVCLLHGGNDILAAAWPRGDQRLRLVAERDHGASRFRELELDLDGKSVCVGVMSAPSIWHREQLSAAYFEKDVVSRWRRPFPARWKTQLLETGVPTSFAFVERAKDIWRPEEGSYPYPVRFAGDRAVFRLGKKIPPKGEAFVYALDGHRDTPFEFMRRCPASTAGILAGLLERKDDPPPVRRKVNVGFQHCWGTALAKRTLYRYGMQQREAAFLEEHADNYADLTETEQRRHQAYFDFIAKMREKLGVWKTAERDAAGLRPFFTLMASGLDRLEAKCREPMEGKAPAEYIREGDELAGRLKILIRDGGTESYPETCAILERLNAISAAMHEDVGKPFGTLVRDLFQRSAAACADAPGAIPYARAFRSDVQDILKTRDYEVVDEDD